MVGTHILYVDELFIRISFLPSFYPRCGMDDFAVVAPVLAGKRRAP